MKHIDKTAVEKALHVAYQPRHAKPRPGDKPARVELSIADMLREVTVGNPYRGLR